MSPPDGTRPPPEHFLGLIQRQQRGRLKIYLGFAAGVGKTYEMLQEGLIDDQHNLDAVKQHIETHFNGRLSAAAVDHSISSMRDTLHWKPAAPAPKPVPPAPPTPPPPAPVDDLPPVPAFMMKNNQLRTKADVGKLGVKYVEYFRGPHGSAFKKRVDEILRRGI